MRNYFITLIKQPSTWRGIIMMITSAGIALSTEQTEAIITCGLAAAGAVGAFIKDA